eukprot:3251445-Pleurochrysis_carterae.AAC.5
MKACSPKCHCGDGDQSQYCFTRAPALADSPKDIVVLLPVAFTTHQHKLMRTNWQLLAFCGKCAIMVQVLGPSNVHHMTHMVKGV